MKLWEKGYSPDETIEKFTVGKDPILDMELLPYDIAGSKAHALVLKDAGVLTETEAAQITAELDEISSLADEGSFKITVSDEDCHTAIENRLTEKLGDIGKKIHTARSRNDQVLTAMRLLQKDKMIGIKSQLDELLDAFQQFSENNDNVPMPGFTHTRKAMPYTLKKWILAFSASLRDDIFLIDAALKMLDQNPLGTGAGYDVPFPLNREISTKELGFSRTMDSAMYAQNSRGKIEAACLFACSSVLMTLNKWAADIILYTMPEFNFFKLDDSLTTGSSIMPHKKNPDVLELIRSSVHQLASYQQQVQSTTLNLMSGYHRDVQLTKEPILNGLSTTASCLEVSKIVIGGLRVNEPGLQEAMTDDLFSVEKVYELVQKGVPFREAYKIIASKIF